MWEVCAGASRILRSARCVFRASASCSVFSVALPSCAALALVAEKHCSTAGVRCHSWFCCTSACDRPHCSHAIIRTSTCGCVHCFFSCTCGGVHCSSLCRALSDAPAPRLSSASVNAPKTPAIDVNISCVPFAWDAGERCRDKLLNTCVRRVAARLGYERRVARRAREKLEASLERLGRLWCGWSSAVVHGQASVFRWSW